MFEEEKRGLEKEIIVLGIESTAHTFGCGIASSKNKILTNVKSVYKPQRGGIHPREASQHHQKVAPFIVKRALDNVGMDIREIDAVAVALGPGLGPCLRVGATVARAISVHYNKPLIPVNHCVAHIEIGRAITGLVDPLVVYVSGGNTIISAFAGGRYRVFGETLDIALGNCLDTFARETGIAPPYIVEGYHVVDYWAERGKEIIDLPYVVKGQDVSYSGLLTAALRLYSEDPKKLPDICLSFREHAYNMIVEVAERALAHTGKRELLLTGGVAASPVLREKLKIMCADHNATFRSVPLEYAGDNGAMIAWTGLLTYLNGVVIPVEKSFIKQRWRLDEVDIPWRKQ